MILYFGGVWQGKREAALARFGYTQEQVYTCNMDIAFTYPVIDGISGYFRYLIEQGHSPLQFVKDHIAGFSDKILLVTDISGGVVPVDEVDRHWREENSRALVFLSQNATEVYRVFCGIETRLK